MSPLNPTFRRAVAVALMLTAGLGLFAAGCGIDPDARRQRHMTQADTYFREGKYQEAAVEYRNAVQIDDSVAEAHAKLAATYEQLGDRQRAFPERLRAADLNPDDIESQLLAGSYLASFGRFEEARSRAERVLALDKNHVRGQLLLGNSLAGLKDFDRAIAEVLRAIQLDPERAATYVNLGLLESHKGSAKQAEEAIRKAIELDPKWIPARLALANHFWATARLGEAEAALQAAVQVDPRHPLANQALALFLLGNKRSAEAEPYFRMLAKSGALPLALADYYLATNRVAEAVAELGRFRSNDQTSDQAARRLARAHVIQKDWSKVARVADEALSRSPFDAEMLLIKAQALLAQRRKPEAREVLLRTAAADSSAASVHVAVGQAFRALGDAEPARKAYHRALELEPGMVRAQIELAQLDLAEGLPDDAVRRARQAVRTGAETSAADRAGIVNGQLVLARALVSRGDLDAADAVLRDLLRAQPDLAEVHVQRGIFFVARRNAVAARHSFERAVALDDGSIDATGGLVSLDLASGDVGAARDRIRAAMSKHGERPELLLMMASADVAARQFDPAVANLQKAIQIDAGLLPAYVLLAEVYAARGQLDLAKQELETVVERQRRPVAALTMLGLLAQLQGDVSTAKRLFERVLDLEPGAPIAANNLAWMYAEDGQNLEIALQLAQAAVRRLPQVASVHDTLGWVYYKKQLPERASEAFMQALSLEPGNPTYHYHLGLVHRQHGSVDRARQSFQRALAAGEFTDAGDARRHLAELDSPTER